MTGIDTARSPMALEIKAYFAGRVLCLQAHPPCAVRPCERHHAEAYRTNGATTCPNCDGTGLDGAFDDLGPCETCDGYGRVWLSPLSALASTSPSAAPRPSAEDVDGVSGACAGSAVRPAPEAPPSKSNRPGRVPRAAGWAAASARTEGTRR